MTLQPRFSATLSLSAVAALVLASSCSETSAAAESSAARVTTQQVEVAPSDATVADAGDAVEGEGPALSVDDVSIETYRTELLELAFEAASAFPLQPHIKNRSRAQQKVVDASLALEQPRRALRYIEGIENWRRGAGYADLAFYCAERGATAEADRFLDLGLEIAREQLSDEDAQEWRTDRILAKAAKTHLLLGNSEMVSAVRSNVVPSEAGAVAAVEASAAADDDFDGQIAAAKASFATGGLDESRTGFAICAALFKRFFDDEERRATAVDTFQSSWNHVPPGVKIETLQDLIEFSLGEGDRDQALALVELAQEAASQGNWMPEDRIRITAELARQEFRCGDERKALADLETAIELFDASREQIVDMFRGAPLRAVAEAYHAMGDEQGARMTYARALAESLENPNARPRADDLVATCISMATYSFEPDAELWEQLRGINSELAEAW